ncbi:MAG TPA: hypothetical protein VJ761_19845 [Ktedonobacteraceae bacterium]|nr:hypothetical protein [Ktedonobacteraceae bacterium]
MHRSEVRQLIQQIELEYEAAQRGLSGLAAGTARHEFITARMENIGVCHESLKELVGEQQASAILTETLERL